VGTVVANDNDAAAVESIRRNVAFAGDAAADVVVPMETDARVLMLQLEKSFDVVDLDPYGTPAMFLDSAMQTVKDGGLMLVTATDMAVLCGNNKEVRAHLAALPFAANARCTRGCVTTQLREVVAHPRVGGRELGVTLALTPVTHTQLFQFNPSIMCPMPRELERTGCFPTELLPVSVGVLDQVRLVPVPRQALPRDGTAHSAGQPGVARQPLQAPHRAYAVRQRGLLHPRLRPRLHLPRRASNLTPPMSAALLPVCRWGRA
jgi:hypothetical protein